MSDLFATDRHIRPTYAPSAAASAMDLFSQLPHPTGAQTRQNPDADGRNTDPGAPLAWRMRPQSLAEYRGQEHLFGDDGLITRQLASGRVGSLILYGPPGCGKTALAHLIARELRVPFRTFNAVTAGIPDLRRTVAEAEKTRADTGTGTLLFIDEIHRFNKTQQSALLPHVENGLFTLIGASTQNPFFAIIPPLASRSHIVELNPLSSDALAHIVAHALTDPERGLGTLNITLADDARDVILRCAEGDARRALNALEVAALSVSARARDTADAGAPADAATDGSVSPTVIQREDLEAVLGRKAVVYDDGDAHYDTISAFIKSIRGSDADAALYWLAKMLEGGEDPLFVGRRLIIVASEDIGNADPRALQIAVAAHQAVAAIGLPEGRIPLAQATTYLALAPKSNAAYVAIDRALDDVRTGTVLPVPRHLRDGHYPGAKELGNGIGYQYPHDHPDHHVAQDYLGADRTYYVPTEQGFEARLAARRDWLKSRQDAADDTQSADAQPPTEGIP